MVASFPVLMGRLDDFQVLGELPPGNDQTAIVRWDLPQKAAVNWGWEQDAELARRQTEQRVWASIRAWDL